MSSAYFCSVCGTPAVQGMNYCKQCGGQINPTTATVAPYKNRYDAYKATPRPANRSGMGISGLAWAIAVASVAGLSVILGTAIPLAAVGLSGPLLGIIILACIAMLGGTVFMLIRQMSRLISAQTNVTAVGPPAQQASLPPSPYPSQITTGPVGMPSVTEGTTRIFDPTRETGPSSS
jgi:hypothetical protein